MTKAIILLLASCLATYAAPLQTSTNVSLPGPRSISPPGHSLSISWRFKAGAPLSLQPVSFNRTITAVTDRGEMITLDMDGIKRWATSLPKSDSHPRQELFTTPPLWVNHHLLVGTDQGQVYAFDAHSGAVKWTTKIGEDIYGALNWRGPEGTNGHTILALSRNNGSLHRIDLATGHILWSSAPIGRSDCSPGVGRNFIAFGACDSALHFIAPENGAALASIGFEAQGPMAGGVAIEGTRVYVGTRDGSIICTDADPFRILWTNQVASSEIFTTPALSAHHLAVGSSDGSVYCLNPESGTKLWTSRTGGTPTSPLIVGDKVIVSSGGSLLLLGLEDGKLLASDKPGDSLTPPAVIDGNIIIGTDDGFLILYQIQ